MGTRLGVCLMRPLQNPGLLGIALRHPATGDGEELLADSGGEEPLRLRPALQPLADQVSQIVDDPVKLFGNL